MEMVNVWNTGLLGNRYVRREYLELFLQRALEEEEIDEEQIEEVRSTPFYKLKLIEELKKSQDLLAALECDNTFVSIMDIVYDQDVNLKITTAEFDALIPAIFEEKVKRLFDDVVKVCPANDEYDEYDEYYYYH